MKIKLKITTGELLYLDVKAQEIVNIDFKSVDREKKGSCSILYDVADKVSKQAKALSRGFQLNKKPHSISFKWHEAEVLEMFLMGFNEIDPLCANLSRKIISQLNQKLA